MLNERDRGLERNFSQLYARGLRGRVSITLPAYSDEPFLDEAVESVRAQTYTDWELIVVCDATDSSTLEIVHRYAEQDERIRCVGKNNLDFTAALNAGQAAAKGEFVTWTLAENSLKPEYLEVFVEELRRHADVDLVYADFECITKEGRGWQDVQNSAEALSSQRDGIVQTPADVSLLDSHDFVGPAFLYRNRVLPLIGSYSNRWPKCEVYDFFLRVNAQMKVRHTRSVQPLCQRRHLQEPLDSSEGDRHVNQAREDLRMFDDYRRDLLTGPIVWRIDWEGAAEEIARQWIEWAKSRGDPLVAKEEDLNAWMIPTVELSVVSDLQSLVGRHVENRCNTTCAVLLYVGDEAPEVPISEDWDLCLHLSPESRDRIDPDVVPGWLKSPELVQLWHAVRVRAFSGYAMDREREANSPCTSSVSLSAVICTNRDTEFVERTLDSLRAQSLPSDQYEIIVVNNAPLKNDLSTLVGMWNRDDRSEADLHIVECYPGGLCHARNAGLRAAQGTVVLYLDDDIVAEEDLFAAILGAYELDDDIGVVGGSIELHVPDPSPWWYTPTMGRFWSQFLPTRDGVYICEAWTEFPWGANWSARRDLLLRIGGFRSRFGRGGRVASSAEEVVAALAIRRLGYSVAVAPKARVLHRIDPARFTLREMFKTASKSFESVVVLATELRITPFWGWRGCLLRGLARVGYAVAPSSRTIPQRLEQLAVASGHFKSTWSLLKLEFRRLKLSDTSWR